MNTQAEYDQYDLANLKTPPHSLEAEQAVLGGLMISNRAWPAVSELLNDQDFYRPGHRLAFQAIARLLDDSKPVDAIILAEELDRAGDLDECGGFGYLIDLQSNTPSASNIRSYAQAVRERSVLRSLIATGQAIADSGFDPEGAPVSDLIDRAQAQVMALGEQSDADEITTNAALRAVVDQIDERFNSKTEITGLPTGYQAIDQRTRGLQKSDLIILAGRPATGKTTMAMNIVEHVAVDRREPVLVFSMEMSRTQLLERMVASTGRLPLRAIQTGQLEESHWPMLTAGVSRLKDVPLTIDDRAGLSVQQMRSAARSQHHRNGLALIVVDYLQLATARSDSRNEEISVISRGLKALAKELNVPIIALSQLSRKVEERPNKRPRNSDLRDSGSIEQDADIVVMMYRDEVYNPDTADKGVAEIIFTKFRNGQIGTDYLASRLDIGRFDSQPPGFRPAENVVPMKRRKGFEL